MRRSALVLLVLVLALAACGGDSPRATSSAAAQPVDPPTTSTAKARPAAAKAERHPPVVMVVFDEFSFASLLDSSGKIDPVLYPNLTKLAKQADVYPHYTTPSDETTSLFAALLTSKRYDPHRKPDYRALPRNLFTDFAKSGYGLKVREAATNMCPPKLCPGDAPPKSAQDVLSQLANGRIERFRKWMGLIQSPKKPTLWWTHLMLPHGPLAYDAAGQKYNPFSHEEIPGLNNFPSFGDPWLVRQGWQRYQLHLLLVDRLVGELIAQMKRAGIYDRSLLVLTADHGGGFGHMNSHPHQIDHRTAVDIASTPLIVKRPRQARGRYVGRHVRLYDLLPGVAQIAHVKTGPTYGYSFAGAAAKKIPSQVVTLDRKGKVRRWSFGLYRKLLRATIARRISVFGQHGAELSSPVAPGPALRARRQAGLGAAHGAGEQGRLLGPDRSQALQRGQALERVPAHPRGGQGPRGQARHAVRGRRRRRRAGHGPRGPDDGLQGLLGLVRRRAERAEGRRELDRALPARRHDAQARRANRAATQRSDERWACESTATPEDAQAHRRRQPMQPSIWSSIRRFISTAYSIGSSFVIGSMKPLTMSLDASSSGIPRDSR